MSLLPLITFFLLFLSPLSADSGYTPVADQNKLKMLSPALAGQEREKLILGNGLEVLLISDPKTQQSGAALVVDVGSWDDGQHAGMAHLVEHMLFLGTKTYPNEKGYHTFIAQNGGSFNAYTASEKTVYTFSINNEGFIPILGQFAHFFIDPLLNPDAIARELKAVNEEHEKNKASDSRREFQVLKEIANPDHPFHAFATGNKETLENVPVKDIRAWVSTHYSANKMHLILLSNLPLAEMRALTIADFTKIPSFKVQDEPLPENIFPKEIEGSILFIEPKAQTRELTLLWQLPPHLSTLNDAAMANLVASVLGSEADNSLPRLLKNEQLATGVSAGTFALGKDVQLFQISVALTEEGLKKELLVMRRCFEAILRVQKEGVPSTLFDDFHRSRRIDYSYQDRADAYALLESLAGSISDEPLATFPEKSVDATYKSTVINQITDSLTPQKCLFILVAKDSGATFNKNEKWMDVPYEIVPLTPEIIKELSAVKLTPLLTLPSANPYLLHEIKPLEYAPLTAVKEAIPEMIINTPFAKIYYERDDIFLKPKSAFSLKIYTSGITKSAKSFVLCDLFGYTLTNKLSEKLVFAANAGITCSSSFDYKAISLFLEGFDENIDPFMQDFVNGLKNLQLTKKEFIALQNEFKEIYKNQENRLPCSLAREEINAVIVNPSVTTKEQLDALSSLSYEDFNTFSKELFNEIAIEGVIYGAMDKSRAKDLFTKFQAVLNPKTPLPEAKRNKDEVLVLGQSGPFLISKKSDMPGNGIVLIIEQGECSHDRLSIQQCLGSLIDVEFYNTLRTKQQTAYIASSWNSRFEMELLQSFALQSSSHEPEELLARINLFLETLVDELPNLLSEDNRFEKIKQGLITSQESVFHPDSMGERAGQLHSLLFRWKDIDFYNKRLESLKNLTLDSVVKNGREIFSHKNRARIASVVRGKDVTKNRFIYKEVKHPLEIRDEGKMISRECDCIAQ